MAVDVIMPHMGESVVEGKIISWLKNPGERVEEDEPLVELSTDKIDVEVPAPASGVLLKVLAEEGATVEIDQVIAVIGDAGEEVARPAAQAPKPTPAPSDEKPKTVPAPPAAPISAPAPPSVAPPVERPKTTFRSVPVAPPKPAVGIQPTSGPVAPGTLSVLASPAVRRFARQLGLDLGQVTGTGRLGRITREDVQHYSEDASAVPEEPEKAPEEAALPKAAPDVDEELVALSPMRRAIAEHMVRSRREAPHVTTIAEVDMSGVAALRALKKAELAADGVKLTYMAFILNAVARALGEYPDLNASWTDDGIRLHYRIHIGIAVSVPDGLVVPVIRHVDRLSIPDLARAVESLAEKTRQGKVAHKDLSGGTFTITNPGVFGAVISTPIIHQPQAAILATGRIADVPAVVEGEIAVRKHMFLSLSYDHRVVDGATAVQFLQKVRTILEAADFEV